MRADESCWTCLNNHTMVAMKERETFLTTESERTTRIENVKWIIVKCVRMHTACHLLSKSSSSMSSWNNTGEKHSLEWYQEKKRTTMILIVKARERTIAPILSLSHSIELIKVSFWCKGGGSLKRNFLFSLKAYFQRETFLISSLVGARRKLI